MVTKLLALLLLALVLVPGVSAVSYPQYFVNYTNVRKSTTTTEIDVHSLTWTAEADSTYLVMGNFITNNTVTTNLTRINVWNGTSNRASYYELPAVANTEMMPSFFVDILTGTGASVTYTVKLRNSGAGTVANAGFVEGNLIALRIDNMSGAHYNYSYYGPRRTNLDRIFGDDAGDNLTVEVTPSSTGYYLIIASTEINSDSTSSAASLRLNVNYGNEFIPYLTGRSGTNLTYGYVYIEDSSTSEESHMSIMAVRELSNSQTHTFQLQYADIDGTASADVANTSLVVIRLTGVFDYLLAQNTTEDSMFSTSYRNYTILQTTPNNASNFLILGNIVMNGNSTSIDQYSKIAVDGTAYFQSRRRYKDVFDSLSYVTVFNKSLDTLSHFLTSEYRSNTAALKGNIRNSDIIAIRLDAPPCSPNIVNTTQAPPQNTTCNETYELTNWTWWVEWDSNVCGSFSNITWYANNTLSCGGADSDAPDLNFVPPTPDNNSMTPSDALLDINVTGGENLSACLFFNTTANISMPVYGIYCEISFGNLTPWSVIDFQVYANDTAGNLNVTEWRRVTIDPPSVWTTSTDCTFNSTKCTSGPNGNACYFIDEFIEANCAVTVASGTELHITNTIIEMQSTGNYLPVFLVDRNAWFYVNESSNLTKNSTYYGKFDFHGNISANDSIFDASTYIDCEQGAVCIFRGMSMKPWYCDASTCYVYDSTHSTSTNIIRYGAYAYFYNYNSSHIEDIYDNVRVDFVDCDLGYVDPTITAAGNVTTVDSIYWGDGLRKTYIIYEGKNVYVNFTNTEFSYLRANNDGNATWINLTKAIYTYYQDGIAIFINSSYASPSSARMTGTTIFYNSNISSSVNLYNTHTFDFRQSSYGDNYVTGTDFDPSSAGTPTVRGFVNMVGETAGTWGAGSNITRVFPFNVTYTTGVQASGANISMRYNGAIQTYNYTDANGLMEILLRFNQTNYTYPLEVYYENESEWLGNMTFMNDSHNYVKVFPTSGVADTTPPSPYFTLPAANNTFTQNESYVYINVSGGEALSACTLQNGTGNLTATVVGSSCYYNMTGQSNQTQLDFRMFANDTAGNPNVTVWYRATINLTEGAPPVGDTCDTCNIDCTENCVVDSTLVCNSGFTATGPGVVNVTHPIEISGAMAIIRQGCYLRCLQGGRCFT